MSVCQQLRQSSLVNLRLTQSGGYEKIKARETIWREALYDNLQGNVSTAGEKILAQISVTPGKF